MWGSEHHSDYLRYAEHKITNIGCDLGDRATVEATLRSLEFYPTPAPTRVTFPHIYCGWSEYKRILYISFLNYGIELKVNLNGVVDMARSAGSPTFDEIESVLRNAFGDPLAKPARRPPGASVRGP